MNPHLNFSLPVIVDLLRKTAQGVVFAESCTGGRLAADLTTIPGSSEVVIGSLVCYQTWAKESLLGLTGLNDRNVASYETARRMASAIRLKMQDSPVPVIGVSTTGWLDGEHNGRGPHGFWSIFGPRGAWVGDITFPVNTSRGVNRELLLERVFDKLAKFLSDDFTD